MTDPVNIHGESDALELYDLASIGNEKIAVTQNLAPFQDKSDELSKVKAKKLHPHHGTNASSDAAGLPCKAKKYHCSFAQCGKEFSTSGHMTRHQRVHTGERNFTCPKCSARFSRQDNCNQHAKSHNKSETKTTTVKELKDASKPVFKSPTSMASTESLPELVRPQVFHTTSYAGSHVAFSEADYASSSNGFYNDLDLSPEVQSHYDFGTTPHALSRLPESLYDLLASDVYPPNLVYDSSAAETDESANHSFNLNKNDFISEEDFYNWSAGVTFPEGDASELLDEI